MSVIAPETRAERYLYLNLTTDATIAGIVGNRVYSHVAPATVTTYPLIVFQKLASLDDTHGNASHIIWSRMVYLVKAITEGDSATSLQTLVDRMMTVLHATHGATPDARVDYCVRKRPFRMVTQENNRNFQHLGGEFELAVAVA